MESTAVVDMYMNDVRRQTVLLTSDKEVEVASAAQNGDKVARQTMINSNLRLVMALAHRYKNHTELSLADLIQEGNAGLMIAVDKFDVSKGYKFSTYATWWIKNGIDRAILNTARTIRVPIHIGKKYRMLSKYGREFAIDIYNEKNHEAMAVHLGIADEEIKRVISCYFKELSLDVGLFDDDEQSATYIDHIVDLDSKVPEHVREDHDKKITLMEALATLRTREREMINLRFGLGREEAMTLDAIANRMGLSRERVRQVITDSLSKLNKKMAKSEFTKFDLLE